LYLNQVSLVLLQKNRKSQIKKRSGGLQPKDFQELVKRQ
jgi:hypothetical protein